MTETKAIQQQSNNKPVPMQDQLSTLLKANHTAISKLVPQHMTPERLMRVAVNCVAKTPDLQKCTASSLLSSIMAAAEVGLEPGGVLGQFYLVPFGQVCTPIIGYKGLLELARRTGEVTAIHATVVYDKDRFRFTKGIEQVIDHEPYIEGDAGPLKYVYAVAKLRSGEVVIEVMSRSQVDAIRARSRSGQNGPWKTDYDEMAKKTVFRRLAKWLPIASERFEKALEMDNNDYVEGEVTAANEAVTSELTNVKNRVGAKVRHLPGADLAAVNVPAEESQSDAQVEPPPAS